MPESLLYPFFVILYPISVDSYSNRWQSVYMTTTKTARLPGVPSHLIARVRRYLRRQGGHVRTDRRWGCLAVTFDDADSGVPCADRLEWALLGVSEIVGVGL